MRCLPLLAALLIGGCAAPSWRPAELASVKALRVEPATAAQPAEDVAMGLDGALLLPSPEGGPPITVPHRTRPVSGLRAPAAPLLDPNTPANTAPGLGWLLWDHAGSAAPYHSGVQLYRSQKLKLLIGTRTLIDDRYPDAVTTDPRHEPQGLVTAAVVGLRLGF